MLQIAVLVVTNLYYFMEIIMLIQLGENLDKTDMDPTTVQ